MVMGRVNTKPAWACSILWVRQVRVKEGTVTRCVDCVRHIRVASPEYLQSSEVWYFGDETPTP